MTPATPLLEMHEVTKSYARGRPAVEGITATLEPGLTGLLGPNGAGKSTLMRILATVTRPTSGRVLCNGRDIVGDPAALRSRLGYLPQHFGVYPKLTGREFLLYLAAAKGVGRRAAASLVDDLLELVNLTPDSGRALGGYSGGMLRRVGIAQALLTDPDVLVIDEPTAGLDPDERAHFRTFLNALAVTKIVLLSTHIVSDVELTATNLLVLVDGRVCYHGDQSGLTRLARPRVWEAAVPVDVAVALRNRCRVTRWRDDGEMISLRTLGADPPVPQARTVSPSLEEAYLTLLGNPTGSVI